MTDNVFLTVAANELLRTVFWEGFGWGALIAVIILLFIAPFYPMSKDEIK